MRFFFTPLFESFFPSIKFRMNGDDIYLTFDDGPHPEATPMVLDILRKRNIPATFFLLGENVCKYKEIVQRIVYDGHTIGSHSYNHHSFWLRSKQFIIEQIEKTDEILSTVCGIVPTLFRPPFGALPPQVIKAANHCGKNIVLMSIDSGDYSDDNPSEIADYVIQKIAIGDIVVFHDNKLTSKRIKSYLNTILDALQENNFNFNKL